MRSFDFVAIDASGKTVTGVRRAADVAELDRQLEGKGLTLTRSRPSDGARERANLRLKQEELINFTTQLATMVSAGVPLVEGLASIGTRLESPASRAVVERMVKELKGGLSLSQVMEGLSTTFPPVYRSSVVAGEESGALDEILMRLADHLEWTRSIRATTMQALIYPFCLLIGVVGLVMILLLFVLPRILAMFPGGAEDLPPVTTAVIGASDFLRATWPLIFGGAAVVIAGVVSARKTDRGKRAVDRVMLGIPKLGRILRGIATSKFANTASTLHRAGCDIFTVLETSARSTGNAQTEHEYQQATHRVRRGDALSVALESTKHADSMLVQLVSVGERTGRLDHCLDRLVKHLDQEIHREVKRFLAWLEPVMLIGAGGVVGLILLATILPIFQMYETIG